MKLTITNLKSTFWGVWERWYWILDCFTEDTEMNGYIKDLLDVLVAMCSWKCFNKYLALVLIPRGSSILVVTQMQNKALFNYLTHKSDEIWHFRYRSVLEDNKVGVYKPSYKHSYNFFIDYVRMLKACAVPSCQAADQPLHTTVCTNQNINRQVCTNKHSRSVTQVFTRFTHTKPCLLCSDHNNGMLKNQGWFMRIFFSALEKLLT